MNYLYPTTDKQVAEKVKELNKLIFLDLMNLGLPIGNKGTNHLKNIIILGVLNADNDYCYLQTLKLYYNGIVLAYIGFFVASAGIFLTVASVVLKLIG